MAVPCLLVFPAATSVEAMPQIAAILDVVSEGFGVTNSEDLSENVAYSVYQT